jgi:DNA-binding MarR family transcriptional regulator
MGDEVMGDEVMGDEVMGDEVMGDEVSDAAAWQALGLTPVEGDVLRLVLSGEEVTHAQLLEATGVSASGVSRAVAALERQGLLDRVPGRKPMVLFLREGAREAFDGLVERQAAAQSQVRATLEVLSGQVAEGVTRAAERGRPYFERDPRPRGLTELARPSRRGRTQHDEVVAASSLRPLQGARSTRQCSARILVAGSPGKVDLGDVARVQSAGSQVRSTPETLPVLHVLDGVRVGVWASTREGWRQVWSNDAAHVRAVSEVFALWWDRAQPVDP